MNRSANKVSVLKVVLVFTGIVLLNNFIMEFIACLPNRVSFYFNEFIFQWDYLKFNIASEGLIIFLTALGTNLVTKRLPDFRIGTLVIRAVTFATFYAIVSILYNYIFWFCIYDDLVWEAYKPNPRVFNGGLRDSFLFIVVWMVLKYRPTVPNPTDLHI